MGLFSFLKCPVLKEVDLTAHLKKSGKSRRILYPLAFLVVNLNHLKHEFSERAHLLISNLKLGSMTFTTLFFFIFFKIRNSMCLKDHQQFCKESESNQANKYIEKAKGSCCSYFLHFKMSENAMMGVYIF